MLIAIAETTIGKFGHRLSLKYDLNLHVLATTINFNILQIIWINRRMKEIKVEN